MTSPTSIQRALGVDEALSYELIARAVTERVAEDEQLEWKLELSADKLELAKDVTALANARGGLLVYGVAEERGTGRASATKPIDLRESATARLRSAISSAVHPQVTGVRLLPLREDLDANTGVLVVEVPASPDAPHIIGSANALGVPYRIGTDTVWMSEWDLERAYRDRFARRTSDEARLGLLIEHARDHLDLAAGPWLIVAVIPTAPVRSFLDPVDKTATVSLIQHAESLARAALPQIGGRLFMSLGQTTANPSIGLRRWILEDHGASALASSVHIEIHLDGSVIVAGRSENWPVDGLENKNAVHDVLITAVCTDAVAVAAATMSAAGHNSHLLVRAELTRPNANPFALIVPNRHGGFEFGRHQPAWTRDLARFVPVETTIAQPNTPEQLAAAAKFLATDIVTQFGYLADHLDW